MALLMACKVPPPMVFVLEWNSTFNIPSPKWMIEASALFQTVFVSFMFAKETKSSVQGITLYSLAATS